MRFINNGCITVATILLIAGLAGCGGSSDGGMAPPAPTNITRGTEASFSDSARVLAARDAAATGATWLDAGVARAYDADLAVIRATFPQVKDIQARSDYDAHTIVVAVLPNAPWLSKWTAGNVTTGEAALDALLTEFAPDSVLPIGSAAPAAPAYFTLHFGQSLNMVKLAERVQAASTSISAATPNYTVGASENIKNPKDVNSTRHRYLFSRGSGDCQAGCTKWHMWTFNVSDDGKQAALTEEYDASQAIPY